MFNSNSLGDVLNRAYDQAIAATDATPKPAPPPKAKLSPPLQNLQRNLIAATKERRMRTQGFYLCDVCDAIILRPENGFVVHGNIYVADPTCRGGLIGNFFPDVKPGDKIEVTDVKEAVYCKKCFLLALGVIKPDDQKPKPVPGRAPITSSPLNNEEFLRELQAME